MFSSDNGTVQNVLDGKGNVLYKSWRDSMQICFDLRRAPVSIDALREKEISTPSWTGVISSDVIYSNGKYLLFLFLVAMQVTTNDTFKVLKQLSSLSVKTGNSLQIIENDTTRCTLLSINFEVKLKVYVLHNMCTFPVFVINLAFNRLFIKDYYNIFEQM
jgi:hypothetical protein